MISREIVTAVSGTYVYTAKGRRRCAGNALFAVGDAVTVIGGLVVGWRRRSGVSMSMPDAQYYHFADASAMKMYYLDTEFFAIDQTDDIAQPVDETTQEAIDAALRVHCYDAENEYLVWFLNVDGANSRCIIQNSGETIADFTSVFASMPDLNLIDACIDGGDLVWVAAYVSYNSIVMAKFLNGTMTESKTYDPQNATDALASEIDTRYEPAAAGAAAIISNTTRMQPSAPVITRRDAEFGDKVHETITGLVVNKSGTSASADDYKSLIDLWGLDFKMSTRGSGSWKVKYVMHHDQWDVLGNLFASYDSTLSSVWLEVAGAGNYSLKNNEFESLVIVPDSEVVTGENPEISITQQSSITKESDETLTYSVSAAVSATSFKFNHDGSSRTFYGAPAGCKLTWTSGPNVGQSKIISNSSGTNSGGTMWLYTVTFGSAWATAPVAGDTFELEVSYATSDWDVVIGDVTLTANCPSADSGSDSTVTTEYGNGFSAVQTLPKAIAEQRQYPSQDIKFDGASVYQTAETPQSYFPFGAWGPDCGLLVNYDSKLLVGGESGATVSEFNLFSGTVTKRFVEKSEEV